MELSSSQMKTVQHQFDSFCKRLLANEAKDYKKEISYRTEHEVSFSELSEQEMNQLLTMDEYFVKQHLFNVLGYDISIKNELMAEALRLLPEQRRDIILLYFFLDMTDEEIADAMNLVRSTVQYKRTRTLNQLKKIMKEGQANAEHEQHTDQ